MLAKGSTVEQPGREAFRTAMAPVYDEYRSAIGDSLVDQALKLSA